MEVSAQEACYLTLQLPLTRSSRDVVFINTAPAEERKFLLKSKEELEQLPENSENIPCSNQIERYAKRPNSMERCPLADYIAKYIVTYPKKNDEEFSNLDNRDDDINGYDDTDAEDEGTDTENEKCFNADAGKDEHSFKPIRYKNGTEIHKRKRPRVIRYIRYNKKFDEENHYREKLMLFYPRRKESEMLGSCQSYKERYEQVKYKVLITQKQYESHAEITG